MEGESSEEEAREFYMSSNEEDKQGSATEVEEEEEEDDDNFFVGKRQGAWSDEDDHHVDGYNKMDKEEQVLDADRDGELDELDREYKELQAQEVELLRGLKGRSDEEVLKARAVRSQKVLWDKALEVRILLQKPFSSANRLPSEDVLSQVVKSNGDLEHAFSKLSSSSMETLRCLTRVTEALSNQIGGMIGASDANNPSGNEEGKSLPNDLHEIWQQISTSYSMFAAFRDSTVDRWHRKTQLSTGTAASRSKLRAFNQTISKQVANHMRDYSRMLQRMRMKRASVNIIGMPPVKDQTQTSPNSTISNSEEGSKDFDGDPELIDDTEFYQELLREFLESSDPAAIGSVYAVRKMRNKHRKVVDRRASKGRKIRYNIHDKILNFMAPIPMNMPPMAEKLFSKGLFQGGHNQPMKV